MVERIDAKFDGINARFGVRDAFNTVFSTIQLGLSGFLDWFKGAESAIGEWVNGWAKGIQDWWSGVASSLTQPIETPHVQQPGYGRG